MNTKIVATFVLLSGIILLGIGATILLTPEAFHASNGIVLGENSSLLSELRAPGGLLVASGLLILASSYRHTLRPQSVALATLVYGTFGLSRLLSMALDGLPSAGIVGATAVELTMAVVGLLILTQQTGFAKATELTRNPTATPSHEPHAIKFTGQVSPR